MGRPRRHRHRELGTLALDHYRGYVGQSRSRIPTHTWNTTPGLTDDHGGVLADKRASIVNLGSVMVAAGTRHARPGPFLIVGLSPRVRKGRSVRVRTL